MVARATGRFFSGQPVRLLVSILGWVHRQGHPASLACGSPKAPYRDLSSRERFTFCALADDKPGCVLIRDAGGVLYSCPIDCPIDWIAPAAETAPGSPREVAA